jgi:hypothetical protein
MNEYASLQPDAHIAIEGYLDMMQDVRKRSYGETWHPKNAYKREGIT